MAKKSLCKHIFEPIIGFLIPGQAATSSNEGVFRLVAAIGSTAPDIVQSLDDAISRPVVWQMGEDPEMGHLHGAITEIIQSQVDVLVLVLLLIRPASSAAGRLERHRVAALLTWDKCRH